MNDEDDFQLAEEKPGVKAFVGIKSIKRYDGFVSARVRFDGKGYNKLRGIETYGVIFSLQFDFLNEKYLTTAVEILNVDGSISALDAGSEWKEFGSLSVVAEFIQSKL